MTPVEQITSLYIGYFGRAPDPEGLDYWVGRLADGFSLAEIAESFSVQAESQAKYPYLSNPNIASPQAFITQVYLNLFNRVPDAEGLAYWTAQLEGGADVGDFILDVISGAVTNPDKAIIDNKIEVGADFALKAANEAGFVYDDDAAEAAFEVINGVNETQASVDAGKAETDTFLADAPGADDEVFTLTNSTNPFTAGVDDVSAGAWDDTIRAISANSLDSGDTIIGGPGSDVLNISAGALVDGAAPVIQGVERLNNSALGVTLDLSAAQSVAQVWSSGNSGGYDYNNADIAQIFGAENAANGSKDIDINFEATLDGSSDTVTFALDDNDASVATFDSTDRANIEGVAIAALGTAGNADVDDQINIDAFTAAKTLTVIGGGDIVVDASGATALTTVDLSAATGAVAVDISGATGAVTATGSVGNDSFNFGTNLTTADVVNGGTGTDTVRVNASADISAAADAAPFNSLTSIERVAFDGAGGVTLNGATFTNTGITNIEFNTTAETIFLPFPFPPIVVPGNDVINNAGSARTYEFGVNNTGSATFNMNGPSATTLNLALLGTMGGVAANDGNDADVDNIIVNLAGTAPAGSVATININSMGDLAETAFNSNDVGVITAVAGSTINVSGAGNFDLEGLTNRGIVNASTATGNLVLEGSQFTQFSAGSAAVPGNNGPDGIAGNADDVAPVPAVPATAFVSGADTITLGTGQDTVQFSSALDSGIINTTNATTTAQGVIVDIINGFTAGANGDVLDFTGIVGDADYTAITADDQAEINALSGGNATLQNAASIAADFVTADEWTAFTFQGQTYALYSANNNTDYEAGTDLLVQITGVTVANLTDANFA